MKNPMLAITFCTITAFAVACNRSEDQSPSQQLDDVRTESKADAQDMKDYAYTQRSDFVAKMQSQLDALNADLDRLSLSIENSSAEVKEDAKPKLRALRNQAARLHKQLDEAEKATETTWDNSQAGSEKTFASLKADFQQTRQWASDKIAP
jgi:predicted  nucleic acid-binding Zn-ribbon protein